MLDVRNPKHEDARYYADFKKRKPDSQILETAGIVKGSDAKAPRCAEERRNIEKHQHRTESEKTFTDMFFDFCDIDLYFHRDPSHNRWLFHDPDGDDHIPQGTILDVSGDGDVSTNEIAGAVFMGFPNLTTTKHSQAETQERMAHHLDDLRKCGKDTPGEEVFLSRHHILDTPTPRSPREEAEPQEPDEEYVPPPRKTRASLLRNPLP